MRLDLSTSKLSETSSKVAQEAEAYLEAIRSFGPGFDRNLTESHRQCLLDEISRISQILLASLERRNLKEENAWAYPRHMGSNIYVFLATDDPPEDNQVRIPILRFKNIADELNKSVAEGNLDQQLSFLQGTFPTAVGLILQKYAQESRSEQKPPNPN